MTTASIIVLTALIAMILKIIIHLDYVLTSKRIRGIKNFKLLDPSAIFHVLSPVFLRNKGEKNKVPGLLEKRRFIRALLVVFYACILAFFIHANIIQ